MSKFFNCRTKVGDITFDSKGEAARYVVLKRREDEGRISNLSCQKSYTLTVNGQKICVYRADFTYRENGREIVEDYKSKATITPTFRLKEKLMKACHDISIKIVFEASAP